MGCVTCRGTIGDAKPTDYQQPWMPGALTMLEEPVTQLLHRRRWEMPNIHPKRYEYYILVSNQ